VEHCGAFNFASACSLAVVSPAAVSLAVREGGTAPWKSTRRYTFVAERRSRKSQHER
jgi:hypothetical protein